MSLDRTRRITATGIGIALYAVVSMILKIPLVNHITLDLRYVVLGVYCYLYGGTIGAIVGAVGCVLVSYFTTGFFPAGWLVGNTAIGSICGSYFKYRKSMAKNILVTIASIILGILVIKTAIEVLLYGVPLQAKLVSDSVASITDSITMVIGVLIAPKIARYWKF